MTNFFSKKKGLFIIYKATSELDFILPLIWKLRARASDCQLKVFYAVPNKKTIVRDGAFYSLFLKKMGVVEIDLIDSLAPKYKLFERFLRCVFKTSYWDGVQTNIIVKVLVKITNKFLRFFEFIISKMVNFNQILSDDNNDFICFALRDHPSSAKVKIIKILKYAKSLVFLYPHGAFPSCGDYNICLDGKVLPPHCDVWYSFIRETIADLNQDKKDQLAYVGYPGVDSDWCNYITNVVNDGGICRDYRPVDGKKVCLFLIRKFVKNNQDAYVFEESDFVNILKYVLEGIKRNNIHLLIKPHPSNDFCQLEKVISGMGIDSYDIVNEPVITLVPQVDFVINVPSTTMLISVLSGKPMITFESSVKKKLEEWAPKFDIFNGLEFFAGDRENIPGTIDEVVELLRKKGQGELEKKIEFNRSHYRAMYPDKALDLCIDRIQFRIENEG